MDNIFAAVDRFNVVSFWNTFTGKLIHKKVLEGTKRIQNASSFRHHSYRERYEDPANLFNSVTQTLISYKLYPKESKEKMEGYKMKIIKFNLFCESQENFDVSCDTLCSFKMQKDSAVHVSWSVKSIFIRILLYNQA